MTIAYRSTCDPGEVEAAIAAGELPFGDTVRPADAAYYAELVEPERTVLAEEAGRIVGVGAAMSHDCSVPGGAALPLCAVGLVSVLPTHRRRGVARSLVERLHRAAAERGEPLAGLMASEPPFPASPAGSTRGSGATSPATPTTGAAGRGPACSSRTRTAASPNRIKQAWTAAGPDHTLLVEDLVAVDDEALAGLWAYCLGVDLVGSVRAQGRPRAAASSRSATGPQP